MPGSVHSGSASWEDCGWIFSDELCVNLIQNRFPCTLCLESSIVSPLQLPNLLHLKDWHRSKCLHFEEKKKKAKNSNHTQSTHVQVCVAFPHMRGQLVSLVMVMKQTHFFFYVSKHTHTHTQMFYPVLVNLTSSVFFISTALALSKFTSEQQLKIYMAVIYHNLL